MQKRVNVVNSSKGMAIRTTVTNAEQYVRSHDGSHFIPKKKLKALIKTQKKRNEQDRIREERVKRNQKRLDDKKQAYKNMQILKDYVINIDPEGPKDM